ncbi:MAG: hypothetical protein ABI488_01435 [Polyangiaceae bacterium]
MKLQKLAWFLWVALSGSSLVACGSNKAGSGDEYLVGAPEESALQLGVTDDASSEGQASESDDVDAADEVAQSLGETTAALPAQVAPELAHCREAVRDLNQALRSFMQPIVALVRDTTPHASVANVKVWGPVTRGATEFRFVMHRGAARHFGWLLEARPDGTTDKFTNVAAGGITVGYTVRRGVGTVGIDLDALGALDPTVVARGTLFASFAHGPNGSALAYRLHGFTVDPALKAGVDAVVQGVHLKAGFNRERLAYYGNVADTASELPEFVLARARHLRGIGGRADLLATGGDIADGKVWVVSECWDASLKSAYRIVRECPSDSIDDTCPVIRSVGEASACAADVTDADLPPSDPNASMSDPESPEGDLTPPATMPDGTPPQG